MVLKSEFYSEEVTSRVSGLMLSDMLNANLIKVPLKATTKEEVIGELVDLLASNDKVRNRDDALKAVLDRENVMSTGVGESVAIPHGKSEEVDEVVAALGISNTDIDFSSIDEKPVRLVFLLIATPNAATPHLKVLSRVSRLLSRKELRQKLIGADSANEVLGLIRDEELNHFDH